MFPKSKLIARSGPAAAIPLLSQGTKNVSGRRRELEALTYSWLGLRSDEGKTVVWATRERTLLPTLRKHPKRVLCRNTPDYGSSGIWSRCDQRETRTLGLTDFFAFYTHATQLGLRNNLGVIREFPIFN